MLYFVFLIALVFLSICIAILIKLLHSAKRNYRKQLQAKNESLESLDRIVENIHQLLNNPYGLLKWQEQLGVVLEEKFNADGMIIFQSVEDAEGGNIFKIRYAFGICKNLTTCAKNSKNPKNESTDCVDVTFESNIKRFFIYSDEPQLIDKNKLSSCLPENDFQPISGIAAPLKTGMDKQSYILLIRTKDKDIFSNNDIDAFTPSVPMIAAGFSIHKLYQNQQELCEQLNHAQEDGMLQVSTGIIHNIGNGITVLQMSLTHLRDYKTSTEVLNFLKDEIAPDLKSHIDAGDIQQFLTKDSRGKEYADILSLALEQLNTLSIEHFKLIDLISDKFNSISEIIELQQKFIGELGTENVLSLCKVMEDALKMYHSIFEDHHIEVTTSFEQNKDVLIDPALFQHLFVLILKYVVQSIDRVPRSPSLINIKSTIDQIDSKKEFISIIISENGYGIEYNQNSKPKGVSTKNIEECYRDLGFCQQRIEKYHGRFIIKTKPGAGSTVTVSIPLFSDKNI